VNYASNLEFIHGLGTMVSLAPEGAKAIKGGNWQIFANMVKASQADVHLNTAVTNIALLSGSDRKYKITTASTSKSESEPEPQREKGKKTPSHHPVLFDDVIIATPFQYANISTGAADLLPEPIDVIPYATLHVTLFASPHKFSPAFFKLPPGSEVPDSVLTTLGADEEAKPGRSGAGKAGFYSATLQRVVTNPRTRNPEYVYKIFSPEAVTSRFLSELLGVEVTDSSLTHFQPQPQSQLALTPASELKPRSDGAEAEAEAEAEDVGATDDGGNASNQNGNDDDSVVEPISWYHATVFHPYPQKQPRITFQDPVLRDGLYYTSGIESFISTMETSALMGMNVARLIVDGYAEITRSDNQTVESSVPTTPEPEVEQQNAPVDGEVAKDQNHSVDEAGEL
jgi:prenylcysteine oxidase / farnesylcysteine lyase